MAIAANSVCKLMEEMGYKPRRFSAVSVSRLSAKEKKYD